MNTKGLAIIIIGLVSCGTPTAAISQEQSDPVTRAYAKAYGLSVEEAKLRLSKESEITQLQSTLESSEPGYASLRVIHRPQFKVEVLATGDAQALLRRHTKSPDFVAKSVPRSMADLKGAQAAAARVLTNIRAEFETDYDADSGEVNFYVLDDTQARPALDSIIKKFPFVVIKKVSGMPKPTATFIGGQLASATLSCTTGFSVVTSAGVRGVVTAAHCGSPMSIQGVNFNTPKATMRSGDYDQAWFGLSGHTYTNTVYTGDTTTSTIPIKGTASPPVGWPVCKFGRTTKQTCGEVRTTASGVNNQGVVGYFYRVQNYDTGYMCYEGDSGGPVWSSEGGAYGIVFARGSTGSAYEKDMYYQPATRFSALGVNLLTVP